MHIYVPRFAGAIVACVTMSQMNSMVRQSLVVSLASLVSLLSCTPEQEQQSRQSFRPLKQVKERERQSLSGCYTAVWDGADAFKQYFDDSLMLPTSFELTNVPVERGANAFLIKGRSEGSEFRFAQWVPVSKKEARLSWSTGFVGVTVSVSPHPQQDVLEGVATSFSDVPEKPLTARVKLVSIRCS
jgi:hypothetical protein